MWSNVTGHTNQSVVNLVSAKKHSGSEFALHQGPSALFSRDVPQQSFLTYLSMCDSSCAPTFFLSILCWALLHHILQCQQTLFQTSNQLPTLILLSSLSWRWAMHFCTVAGHNDLKQKPSSERPYNKALLIWGLHLYTVTIWLIHSIYFQQYRHFLKVLLKSFIYVPGLSYSSSIGIWPNLTDLLTDYLVR